MAIAPISISTPTRRPASSITLETSRELSAYSNSHAADSTPLRAAAPYPQLPSVSLADVQARQQSANASMRDVEYSSKASREKNPAHLAAGNPISQQFIESFSSAAADPQAFDELLTSIFGDDIDQAQAEAFRQSALLGDFSFLPKVEYVDASVLQGGNGAYSADTNTIYINKELQGSELGSQTFVEEVGHFLDARLNTSDTRGDEGEMFRRLLSGESLSAEAIDAIRAEDDSGSIIVNGEQIDVEFWSLGGFIGGIGSSIGNAVSGIANGVSNVVNSVVDTVGDVASDVIETVGDVMSGAGNVIGNVVSGAGNVVGGLLSSAGNAIGGGVGNALSSAGNGISGLADSVGNGISSGVSWFNSNVFQPVFNTGIELVQDIAPIVTGLASFPMHVLGNAADGLGETFGSLLQGDFSGAWGSFTNTVMDFVLAPAELVVTTIALAANTGVNAVNNLLGLTEERGLNQQEIDYLQPIFGDSIDYGSITIQSGGIKELLGISPQTTGNDIFMRQEWGGDIFNDDGTLTDEGLHLLGHEVGHVWQNQNGGITYVGDALITQGLDAIGVGDGYAIGEALQQGVAFEDMNPEQQASVAEFIGVAIAEQGLPLTAESFSNAAELNDVLNDDEFAIIEAAHVLLKE